MYHSKVQADVGDRARCLADRLSSAPMRETLLAVAALLALAPLACSSDAEDPATTSSSSATGTSTATTSTGAGGAGGDASTSSTTSTGSGGAHVIGGDRPVDVHVPASYDPATPMPLVVLLHGYSATGALQTAYFSMIPASDARGFLFAAPDGLVDGSGNQFWNATDACCNFYNNDVDDSAYLRSVVEDIEAAYNVDPKRIYFIGHSNGGFMSHRMACDHADKIAAIASLAGAMAEDVSLCQPSNAVAVLQIHGTVDDTIAYDGGNILGNGYPSAQQTVLDWVDLDHCSPVEDTSASPISVDATIAGDETTITKYDGCDPGGHAELWTIAGGGHIPSLDSTFAEQVVDFLYAHPKP